MNTFLTEVRETLAPDRTERFGPLPPLLVAMTVVTGLVDSFSYLTLGHVFVANMTGNVVFLGFAIVGAQGFSITASLVALVAFGLGSVLGGRIVARFGHHRGHHVAVATAVQALFLAVSMILALVGSHPFGSAVRYALIVALSLAMGVQNSSVRRLAVPDLTTTVLTLTVTGIGADSALGGGKGSKSGRRLISVAAMFLGALAGAALVLHVHVDLPLVIAFVIVVVVAGVSHWAGRTNPTWTRVEDSDLDSPGEHASTRHCPSTFNRLSAQLASSHHHAQSGTKGNIMAVTAEEQSQVGAANASGRTPVVFIHGLWLLPSSWDRWAAVFADAGYAPLTPGWPDDPRTVEDAKSHPEVFANKSIGEVADHYAAVIEALDKKPAVIGHSFGGLLAQMVGGRGLSAVTVAVDAAPFRGVLPLPISALRSASPVLENPRNKHRAIPLTFDQFHYAFANAVSEEEAKDLFETFVVAAPGEPLFQAAFANLNPWTEAKVDNENPDRGPMLIVSGEKDHTVPTAISKATYKRQQHNKGVTEFVEIPNRGHALTIDSGWREVADTALGFVKRFIS